ncbi:MAG: hypothetical protein WC969_10610 [Elusimicrobiota bacterium]|jgi:hypothetical protein
MDRSAALQEMKRRRVVPQDQEDFSADDFTLLSRVREAQALGAFGLLRARMGTLKGYALESRTGSSELDVWLTVEGYRKYLFLRSQDARKYFETHGAEAKEVFRLRSLSGRDLFDSRGMLTQEGDELFNRIHRSLPAFWRYRDGRTGGNTRPTAERTAALTGAPRIPPAPSGAGGKKPLKPAAEDAEAAKRAGMLKSTGYVEIEEGEEQFLIKTTKLSEADLEKESSLQVVRGKTVVYYLMSPSDPFFALVARYRSGDKSGNLQGTPTFK